MVAGVLPEDGVYLTLQEPYFESLQWCAENSPETLVDQVTLPSGVGEPVTVALQMVGCPTTGVGAHVTLTELAVTANVSLLGGLILSPLYDALRVTGPAFVAVTLTVHCVRVPAGVHAIEERNTLPGPLWVQATVPVWGNVPVTVAVQVVSVPKRMVEECMSRRYQVAGGLQSG